MSKPTRPTERTRTDQERAADDAALLASHEPLATLPELAAMLGISRNMIHWAVQRKGAPLVRYLSSQRPVRHCVADVRAAVEAVRPEIDARRQQAEATEAEQRARGEASRAAKAAAPKKPSKVAGSKGSPTNGRPAPATRPKDGPEVVVVRRGR